MIISNLFAPNVDELVKTKGQPKIPENYPTQVFKNLEKEFNPQKVDDPTKSLMVVFTSDKELTKGELNEISTAIDNVKNDKKLDIAQVVDSFSNKELEEKLISSDKTTNLVLLSIHTNNRSIEEIQNEISSHLKDVSVKHYLTGSGLISADYGHTMSKAGEKTHTFTYIIIFVVLLIVFRSIAAPIISLLTIGMTFIVSKTLILQMVDKFNFPFSSITETFIMLVLFGIGTDYTILLLIRFREELQNSDINTAIFNTYKTAGKTVFLSALTVFVGFSVLLLAKFSIYQSISAVALVSLVLMLEITTLLPVFMKIFGPKLFWPSKSIGHKDSRIWNKVSLFSIKRPIIAVLISLLVSMPLIIAYSNNLSYDMFKEVDQSYDSIKGIDIVSEKYSKGMAFPVTVYLKSHNNLKNNESLQDIDSLSKAIENIPGVKSVSSAISPKGEVIDDFYINYQFATVSDKITELDDGTNKIKNGLGDASDKIPKSTDYSKIDNLVQGTSDLQNGIGSVEDALQQVDDALGKSNSGSEQLMRSISKLKESVEKINKSDLSIQQAYIGLQQGYGQLYTKYQELNASFKAISLNAENTEKYATRLAIDVPEVKKQRSYQALVNTSSALANTSKQIDEGLSTLNSNLGDVNKKFDETNDSLRKIDEGQQQMVSSISDLESGAVALNDGIKRTKEGQAKIVSNIAPLKTGISDVREGELKVKDGIMTLSDNLLELKDGLNKSTDGLSEVSGGLGKVDDYLKEFSNSDSNSMFYLPKNEINGNEFKDSLDVYMSKDNKITKLLVELSVDPYDQEAIKVVNQINKTINNEISNTKLANAQIGIGGVSASNRDLSNVSASDLNRSKIIMLIGIGLVLVLITRTLYMPIFILLSLVIAYYASYAATNIIFTNILHRGDLVWSVPFFSYIMVIALGVDYSIFLITRFNEYKDISATEAIVKASTKIGGVIISAAIILSGTFAALYPGNVATEIELSTIVIISLAFLALIFLPLFLPALISIREKIRNKKKSKENSKNKDKKWIWKNKNH